MIPIRPATRDDDDAIANIIMPIVRAGETYALDPILDAIHALVDRLGSEQALRELPLAEETLQLVLMALGDALLGGAMAKALGLPREKARELAARALLRTRGDGAW